MRRTNTGQRLIALLLTLTMMLGMLSTGAWAAEVEPEDTQDVESVQQTEEEERQEPEELSQADAPDEDEALPEEETASDTEEAEASVAGEPETEAVLEEKSQEDFAADEAMNNDTTVSATFDGNGATGDAPESISAEPDTAITLPENTFTPPTGANFAGWSDGGGTYQPGASYTLAADTAFTALWSYNIPHSDNTVIDMAGKSAGYSILLYDDGGPNGNYGNNTSGTFTFLLSGGRAFGLTERSTWKQITTLCMSAPTTPMRPTGCRPGMVGRPSAFPQPNPPSSSNWPVTTV